MKNGFLLLIISFLIQLTVRSQGSNPCGKSWTGWQNAWSSSYGMTQYRLEFPSKSCGCGWKFVQIKHNLPFRAMVSIWLDGYDCDGKPMTSSFESNTIGGEVSNDQGDWHSFKSVTGVSKVQVEFEDGDKKRIKFIATRSGSTKYINGMTESQYNQQEKQKAAAQTKPSGTGTKTTNGNTGRTSTVSGSNGSNGTRTTQSGGQVRNTNTTTSGTGSNSTRNTQQKPVAPQPDPASEQRRIYQSTALQDLQRAQQSGQSSITQQLHLSNAMITAQASGDANTIRQVQQMQAQATAQNQQQLVESITGLTGSILTLIGNAQQKKREQEASLERWREERRQKEVKEAQDRADFEARVAPEKNRSLQQLEQLINTEGKGYAKANSNRDKSLYALSWLWKWRELERILNLEMGGDPSCSESSLLSARQLVSKMNLSELKNFIWVAEEDNLRTLYPVDFPRKAKKNWKTEYKFQFSVLFSNKSPIAERIDRIYTDVSDKFGDADYYSKQSLLKKTSAERINEISRSVNDLNSRMGVEYFPDSATCIRDGEMRYRYWPGKGWKSIYRAGYTPQKKMEGLLLAANLWLDSAIVYQNKDVIPRAAMAYQKAFDWYFSGPARWIPINKQPASFIRQAMWRYAMAVTAAQESLKKQTGDSTGKEEDPIPDASDAFVKHFEQYIKLDLASVTVPMKLKD